MIIHAYAIRALCYAILSALQTMDTKRPLDQRNIVLDLAGRSLLPYNILQDMLEVCYRNLRVLILSAMDLGAP